MHEKEEEEKVADISIRFAAGKYLQESLIAQSTYGIVCTLQVQDRNTYNINNLSPLMVSGRNRLLQSKVS